MEGVIVRETGFSVNESMNRLILVMQEKGVVIYARIDQQMEALRHGYKIRPFEFVLFGAALPQSIPLQPLATLDSPFKIIIWEDNDKRTWIAYYDVLWFCRKHDLPQSVASSFQLDNWVGYAMSGDGWRS